LDPLLLLLLLLLLPPPVPVPVRPEPVPLPLARNRMSVTPGKCLWGSPTARPTSTSVSRRRLVLCSKPSPTLVRRAEPPQSPNARRLPRTLHPSGPRRPTPRKHSPHLLSSRTHSRPPRSSSSNPTPRPTSRSNRIRT
jgi:hypothetical protein